MIYAPLGVGEEEWVPEQTVQYARPILSPIRPFPPPGPTPGPKMTRGEPKITSGKSQDQKIPSYLPELPVL